MSTWGPVLDTSVAKTAQATLNIAQTAATRDAMTVSGGDVLILSAVVYIVTAAAGLISVAVQTNQTTPVVVMSAAEGALANLTGGKNAKVFTTPTVLLSGQKLQFTIVGTGTGAGSALLVVRYQPIVNGAVLS